MALLERTRGTFRAHVSAAPLKLNHRGHRALRDQRRAVARHDPSALTGARPPWRPPGPGPPPRHQALLRNGGGPTPKRNMAPSALT